MQKSVDMQIAEALRSAVNDISAGMYGYRTLQVEPTGFTVRGPRSRGDEILVVVRGVDHEGAPVVAFHGAYSLEEALLGLAARLGNGTLKWREDQFAK